LDLVFFEGQIARYSQSNRKEAQMAQIAAPPIGHIEMGKIHRAFAPCDDHHIGW
jgi:hypothetical protein